MGEYAERLTFAIHTAQDLVRRDTTFYLIHGCNPISILEAALPVGNTKIRYRDPLIWRYSIQRQYKRAISAVNERLKTAIQDRVDRQKNADLDPTGIEVGFRVWFYLDRLKEGYARKMVHM